MSPNQLIARCLAASLGVVAFGGSGGVAPGDGTYGFLSGVTDTDTVIAVVAGSGCGE